MQIIKVCRRTSEDLSVFVVFLIIFILFLFFSTADFLQRFLRYFSTDLDQIWQVRSPWSDEEPEYNFKSIGPGGSGQGVVQMFYYMYAL